MPHPTEYHSDKISHYIPLSPGKKRSGGKNRLRNPVPQKFCPARTVRAEINGRLSYLVWYSREDENIPVQ